LRIPDGIPLFLDAVGVVGFWEFGHKVMNN
jgi:hypothetical protein